MALPRDQDLKIAMRITKNNDETHVNTSYVLSITLETLHILTCYRHNSSLEKDLFPLYRGENCVTDTLRNSPQIKYLRNDTAST